MPSTPVSRSKSAALSRIADLVGKGYTRFTYGTVAMAKAEALACKFHERHGIGATPAQRITRKAHGRASALLVMFWPPEADLVHWLLLFTQGELDANEKLADVAGKRRLHWLGYELVRRPCRGRTTWTWRRPKEEMAEHYAMIAELVNKHHMAALADLLKRLANQPGFHGVREQTWKLCEEARRRGFEGELPHIFYMQKISHGDRLDLTPQRDKLVKLKT